MKRGFVFPLSALWAALAALLLHAAVPHHHATGEAVPCLRSEVVCHDTHTETAFSDAHCHDAEGCSSALSFVVEPAYALVAILAETRDAVLVPERKFCGRVEDSSPILWKADLLTGLSHRGPPVG